MEDFKPGQFNKQFKAHPPLSELVKMPGSILKYYENLFVVFEVDGDSLPFTGFQSSNWERYSINERKIISDNLAYFKNGFLDGVNKSFIPFADTAENRIKEVLSVAIVIHFSGFPISFKNNFDWLYDLGKKNGEIYKAWTIIFENPATFEDYFISIIANKKELTAIHNLTFTYEKDKVLTKSLKGLFKDETKYNEIIQLMIKNHLIVKTVDSLQWHGYKRNAKYEAVAFLEVLNAKGLLNKKNNDYQFMIEILSGTFAGYTCHERTARNKKINLIARPKYDTLLSLF